ncbi:MAG: PP2C family protein-serine/threonine phosphatase [Acidobacteriota bacterium]
MALSGKSLKALARKLWRKFRSQLVYDFGQSLPTRAVLIFLLALFFTFTSLAFILDLALSSRFSISALISLAAFSGSSAMGYGYGAMRGLKYLPWAALYQIAGMYLLLPYLEEGLTPVGSPVTVLELQSRMQLDAVGIGVGVFLGYIFFTIFITREGRRYLKAHTEIRLAREIHDHLVPKIDRRLKKFEFYGASMPSGEVGGDLVDFVEVEGRWIGYVVDVSGHGVHSGLLMAMVKSAARTRLLRFDGLAPFLEDLNRILIQLSRPNMFATCACISHSGGDFKSLEFALAGHLPILHHRPARGRVEELAMEQFPLGLFPSPGYEVGQVEFESGDAFVLATDGLTEIFDPQGRELGLEGIKMAVAGSPVMASRQFFEEIMSRVRRFGPQEDDQTLLTVKCL